MRVEQPNSELLARFESQLAKLAARLDALERQLQDERQVQLLTDINASLQSTATSAAQSVQDIERIDRSVRQLRSQTEQAFDVVAKGISALQAEVAKKR